MDASTMRQYLERIGAERPEHPTPASLEALHAAHLLTVPFENLSIHLGEEISLDEDALVDKLVGRRRGGFCYELNGAFAALLRALRFDVVLLAARGFDGDHLAPPFDHLVLRVDMTEPWLVDVGFGDHSLLPLRLGDRGPQTNLAGVFTIADADHSDVDVLKDGRPQYRVEARPRQLEDFEPTCWWHATSPRSHFTRSLTCSLPTATGRITLSDRKLIHTVDGRRTERTLESDEDVLAAYRLHFGIVLDRPPHVAR